MGAGKLQTLLRLVYPPRCVACGQQVDSDFGLCGRCWRETPFIGDFCCDACGVPLQSGGIDETPLCDACLSEPRPWERGRAALLYDNMGRKLVLALKHGDRQDIVRPASLWMARVARPLVRPDMLVVPVPLHWTRLVRRRFNQSALLSGELARLLALDHVPDLLIRQRRTQSLDGKSRAARFGQLDGAMAVNPSRARTWRTEGRPMLLVDDVITSGATLAAATEACLAAGAARVDVVALARVQKDA